MTSSTMVGFGSSVSFCGHFGVCRSFWRFWLCCQILWAFLSRSLFWAFVALSSSPLGVCVSVASFRHSGTSSSSTAVCGSVVLVYDCSGLRRPFYNVSGVMQVRRAFRGNVLIYGRFLLCRPRSWRLVPPLTLGDFAFASSLFFMLLGFGERSPR